MADIQTIALIGLGYNVCWLPGRIVWLYNKRIRGRHRLTIVSLGPRQKKTVNCLDKTLKTDTFVFEL